MQSQIVKVERKKNRLFQKAFYHHVISFIIKNKKIAKSEHGNKTRFNIHIKRNAISL